MAGTARDHAPPREPYPGGAGLRSRSPVRDLLFDDVREKRLDEIRTLLHRPANVSAETPLHRITLFLTYRCNLACSYCKTIHLPKPGFGWDPDLLRALLAAHSGAPIRHLHFTGGEAVLSPALSEMIRLAKAGGVARVSVTSNGALPPRRYLDLVAAGIDEIRISIDAEDPASGAAMSGRTGAWEATLRTIRALSAARAAGADFFLILNCVISRANRPRLASILRFLITLGPDDVKLITEVDSRGALPPLDDASRAAVDALLVGLPPDAFPLLRKKLDTVLAPDAIGLDGVVPRGDGTWRCYIPLTERTLDGAHYYPCSVVLREGGAPIGRAEENEATKRAKTAAWTASHACLSDPICKKYCLHCTREYNRRANECF